MRPRAHLARARIRALTEREAARFEAERPRSAALLRRARGSMPRGVPMTWMASLYEHASPFAVEGAGAWFTDADGHRYLDMNLADMSLVCGHAPPPVVAAVAERMRRGAQFLLPTEDAALVAEELARRFGLPFWQFTLSASSANAEVIRLARHATGRERILVFEGKYHGHIEDSLVIRSADGVRPEMAGLLPDAARRARIVPYNDLAAADAALAADDMACVMVEPALTNVGVVLPEPGFLEGLWELSRKAGAVLVLDETHTLACGEGGLTRAWGLRCDAVTVGKSIAGGLPIGAYGMSAAFAAHLDRPTRETGAPIAFSDDVATGGTLYGNALSLAACRAALAEVMTPAGFARTAALGACLADGLEAIVREAGLPWSIHRLFSRSGFTFAPALPRNAAEAARDADPALHALLRLYMANRGVWESIATAGPTVSFATTEADVAFYLDRFRGFAVELAG